jgi:hypothetical protein
MNPAFFASALVAASCAFGSLAQAAHFACASVDGETEIHLQRVALQRAKGALILTADSMQVVDPAARQTTRLIAEFPSLGGWLAISGTKFTGILGERFSAAPLAGRYFGGTTLGQLASISLEIDLSYSKHLSAGWLYAGEAEYIKRDGQVLTEDFNCLLIEGERAR